MSTRSEHLNIGQNAIPMPTSGLGFWLTCTDIFFVCMASIAYEIFLTRLFSIISWSEYGYWIISIAMVGYSVSGVVICLGKDYFLPRARQIFPLLALCLLFFTPVGFFFINMVDFNPMELQNSILWPEQILNIGKYYLALFPFFFFSGMYVGLTFLARQDRIPAVYMADLVGAGLGGLVMLVVMFLLHPFYLLVIVPPMLFLALLFSLKYANFEKKGLIAIFGLFLLVAVEVWLVMGNNAQPSQFKALFASTNVEGSREDARILSPRGLYQIMDSDIERLDVDLSNNYATLGVDGPPRTLGLYRDGDRKTALPIEGEYDSTYLKASLDNLPFILRKPENVLLIGPKGGFRIREVFELGSDKVLALEPEPVIFSAVLSNLPKILPESSGYEQNKLAELLSLDAPVTHFKSLTHKDAALYDIIDVSTEFLDEGPANKYLYTAEGLQRALNSLKPEGILSFPVSISEFTVYAIKAAGTAAEALRKLGIANPGRHILVYRSAWKARILVSPAPFSPADIAKMQDFCSERSFDVSYFYDIDPAKQEIWNDLPPVSFLDETSRFGEKPQDALSEDLISLFSKGELAENFFNLAPATLDRPFFYNILKPSEISVILGKIDIIPRPEINSLVNLLVLAQAIIFALLVLPLPLFKRGTVIGRKPQIFKDVLYFMCLGLGFLFVEITLIERFSFLLGDFVLSFSIVLAAMLISSGIGSAVSNRLTSKPKYGIRLASLSAVVILGVYMLGLNPFITFTLSTPVIFKCILVAILAALPAFFMGFAFPLALTTYRGARCAFLPWAWSINGALSVVATPLASLLSASYGYSLVFAISISLYLLAAITAPGLYQVNLKKEKEEANDLSGDRSALKPATVKNTLN